MADVEISYNNVTIASMNDSGTEILETEGCYVTKDIKVKYTKSGGSVTTVSFDDNCVFGGSHICYVDGNGDYQHTTSLAAMSEVSYQMLSGSILVWASNLDPNMSGDIMGTPTGITLAGSYTMGSGGSRTYIRCYQVD